MRMRYGCGGVAPMARRSAPRDGRQGDDRGPRCDDRRGVSGHGGQATTAPAPSWTALRRISARIASADDERRAPRRAITIQATKSSRSIGASGSANDRREDDRANDRGDGEQRSDNHEQQAADDGLDQEQRKEQEGEHDPERQQHQPERGHGRRPQSWQLPRTTSEERHTDDGQHGQFDHQRSSGPRQGRALCAVTLGCFEKFRGTELIGPAARGVRRQVDLWPAERLVQAADDA